MSLFFICVGLTSVTEDVSLDFFIPMLLKLLKFPICKCLKTLTSERAVSFLRCGTENLVAFISTFDFTHRPN